MVKERIPETDHGIQGELNVEVFDRFRRGMRDKGRLQVENILAAGITSGDILEIGPGPGYFGLEWLKKVRNANLTGIEISSDMIKLAKKNSREYGFSEKTNYVRGNAMDMPFEEGSFDAVISNGSLHEWENPKKVFNEIHRVLKPGGKYCIIDLHRDINIVVRKFIEKSVQPKEIRPGFITSLNAAYTKEEIIKILKTTKLDGFSADTNFIGLGIRGEKKN